MSQRRPVVRLPSAKGRPLKTAGPSGKRTRACSYKGWKRALSSVSDAFHADERSIGRASGVPRPACSVVMAATLPTDVDVGRGAMIPSLQSVAQGGSMDTVRLTVGPAIVSL